MSYLGEMKRILREHETRLGAEADHSVEFVRAGSFHMRVTVHEPAPVCTAIFDLKAGFTPGTQRAIRQWYEPILMRGRNMETEPLPEAAQAAAEPEMVPQVRAAGSFMETIRRLVPMHQRG